jgi:hypothetical protein
MSPEVADLIAKLELNLIAKSVVLNLLETI